MTFFFLSHSWPFFVKCSLKVRFAFIHPLGSHLFLNHLRPRHPPGHQPDRHGQVLCALCSSLQPLAAWNSLVSQEKWADLRCPTQDVPWTEFRCWDVLFSVQVTTKQVQGPVYVTSSTGMPHVLWSVSTQPVKAVFVFWTQALNLRTAEAIGVSKEWWFPSHLLLLWKSGQKGQVHLKYLLLSVKVWLIINIRNSKGSSTH